MARASAYTRSQGRKTASCTTLFWTSSASPPSVADDVHLEPNDRPRGLASRDFLETRVVVHRLGAEPQGVVFRWASLVDRIGLDDRGAVLAGVRDRASEQSASHSLAAMLGWHDEADDGPDGPVVDGLHYGRAPEPREFFARRERDPPYGNVAAVCDEARWFAGVDERLESGTIGLRAVSNARQGRRASAAAVVHAPAPARDGAALRAEDRLDVRPSFRRGRKYDEISARHPAKRCMPPSTWMTSPVM